MLAELSIIPVGPDATMSDELAEVLKTIDASGIEYQLTPTGTCLEGDWDTLLPLVKACHELVRRRCPHVVTLIKLEDDDDAPGKLWRNLQSVERQAGRPLRTAPATPRAPEHPTGTSERLED